MHTILRAVRWYFDAALSEYQWYRRRCGGQWWHEGQDRTGHAERIWTRTPEQRRRPDEDYGEQVQSCGFVDATSHDLLAGNVPAEKRDSLKR